MNIDCSPAGMRGLWRGSPGTAMFRYLPVTFILLKGLLPHTTALPGPRGSVKPGQVASVA